jgi:hypothetical protein
MSKTRRPSNKYGLRSFGTWNPRGKRMNNAIAKTARVIAQAEKKPEAPTVEVAEEKEA